MPHLIIESTKPIESKLIQELHAEVGKQESIKIANLKTRLYVTNDAVVADQQNSEHIAITLKLLAGRSDELKKLMCKNILNKALQLFGTRNLSVEITDLGEYLKP